MGESSVDMHTCTDTHTHTHTHTQVRVAAMESPTTPMRGDAGRHASGHMDTTPQNRGRPREKEANSAAKSPRPLSVSRPTLTADDVIEAFRVMDVHGDGNVTREAFLHSLEARKDMAMLLGLDELSFAEVICVCM
jgi:hypothetical protein